MNLNLEINANMGDKTGIFGDRHNVVMVTPPIGADYWLFRVKLSEEQAILGFPKFTTIGIGFAEEEDWNTNLPYTCPTDQIFHHISHNKGNDDISDDFVKEAIGMVQQAAIDYKSAPVSTP